ncbi:hypothetical protein ANN_10078 [Periplaneta americana]|uniref:Uncharacterized protein n=1 Tax=Periplaneta americana TaxID=6978 RepID=A0ABQ8TQ66_PERAM|nr:hypothetical protein ANN_10078 [Periplaneta americana]
MDLREVGYDQREWINLARNRDRLQAYRNKRDRAELLGMARGGIKGPTRREWSESTRASGAGREERALDFSGEPSLETRGTFEATSLWL